MFHFCSVIARHSCDSSSLRSVIAEGHNSILHNFSVFLTLQLLTVWSGLWHCISVHSSLYIINSDKGYIKSYNSYINNQVVYLLSEEKKKSHLVFFGEKNGFLSLHQQTCSLSEEQTCWWGQYALRLHLFFFPQEITLPSKQPHCKQSFPISEVGLQFVLLYPSAQSAGFILLSRDSEILLQNWKPGIRLEVYY